MVTLATRPVKRRADDGQPMNLNTDDNLIEDGADRVRDGSSDAGTKLQQPIFATETRPRFRMPAEWEPHAATWMIWPQHPAAWNCDVEAIADPYARLVAAIADVEPVHLLVNDASIAAWARGHLARHNATMEQVTCHEIVTNDCWARDCGPTFVERATAGHIEPALVGWRYNAWGGKFPPWDDDAQASRRIADLLGLPLVEPDIVLEGGAIECNGSGIVLTTEACVLDPKRNPGRTRADIETALRQHLGAAKVVWLERGLEGDDTGGHIDNLARFVDERTIVAPTVEDRGDENYATLRANLDSLKRAADVTGRPFRIVRLPLPARKFVGERRLPASYCNFYIANQAVFVPVFECPQDDRALAVIRNLFPNRRVIGILLHALLEGGGGTIHCLTQQQPLAPAMQPPARGCS